MEPRETVVDLRQEERIRPGWSGRRLALLLAVLTTAVAVTLAALLWPRPRPEPDVPGLQHQPTLAWRATSRPETLPVAVGDDALLLVDQGRARLVDAATGDEAWVASVDGVPRDLPGTPWVALQHGSTTRLLDRATGRAAHEIVLPSFLPGISTSLFSEAWLGSTDAGTLVIVTVDVREEGSTLVVTALDAPDLRSVRWSTRFTVPAAAAAHRGETRLVERDGILYEASAQAGDSVWALRMSDGTQPPWARGALQLVPLDDGRVARRDERGVSVLDVSTGAQLWRVDGPDAGVFGDSRALFLRPSGAPHHLRRLDPATGRVRWAVVTDAPFNGADLVGDQVILTDRGPSGPERDDGVIGPTRATAVGVTSGRVEWYVDLDAPVRAVHNGEGQLLLTVYDLVASAADTVELHSALIAVDPETGRARWRWTGEDGVRAVAVVRAGGRLIAVFPDAVGALA